MGTFQHTPSIHPALGNIAIWSQVGLSSCLCDVIINNFRAPRGSATISREGPLIPSREHQLDQLRSISSSVSHARTVGSSHHKSSRYTNNKTDTQKRSDDFPFVSQKTDSKYSPELVFSIKVLRT